jgi:hypothetical protein
MTWAYTVAVRQLMRTRKRQLESAVKGAEAYAAALDRGLADRDFTAEEAEYRLLSAEVRIGCTYGMLLCLSRPLRASHILGDAMGMPDVVAAEICGITAAAQRQRLARARRTVRAIIADRCGLVDAAKPCRCARQIQSGLDAGILDRDNPPVRDASTNRQRPDRDRHDPARRRATRPRPGDGRGLPLRPHLRRTARGLGTRAGRLPRPARVIDPEAILRELLALDPALRRERLQRAGDLRQPGRSRTAWRHLRFDQGP